MRSYNQYCSMARALDVVGDRWALLIVRELLAQGPCRFSDLRRGLPGIASNLLAERLREMQSAGLITRHEEPPPVAATLISLTERGQDLRGVVRELTRWGAP
ncbi:winged helix-turn-helix transcriptional regulator [Actinomadura yumaensis]